MAVAMAQEVSDFTLQSVSNLLQGMNIKVDPAHHQKTALELYGYSKTSSLCKKWR